MHQPFTQSGTRQRGRIMYINYKRGVSYQWHSFAHRFTAVNVVHIKGFGVTGVEW